MHFDLDDSDNVPYAVYEQHVAGAEVGGDVFVNPENLPSSHDEC